MADVFISYHVESASKIVEEIVAALEARKIGTGSGRRSISCWYSGRNMPSGGNFTHIVPSEIKKCNVFLVVMDWGALRSNFVERECAIADNWFIGHNDIFKIMPYRVEDCDSDEGTGHYLINTQRINGIPHTPESLKKLADKVVSTLEIMEKTRREQEDDKKLSTRLLKERQELMKRYQVLQDDNRVLQRENRTLQRENQVLQEETQELQEQYQTLQREQWTLQRENRRLQGENQALQEETQELQGENQKLLEELWKKEEPQLG